MAEEKTCVSCKKTVYQKYVEFPCPKCAKNKVIRCEHCRALSNEYTCTECGFVGP
ncbi:MAG: RNA-binding protein [Candidatus Diapherotrites archaeon]|nr:RNA-binding protein [Candidatus Diapherotrites archaeon]